MNARSSTAQEFRLSLEAGVIDRAEIVQWADGIIATEEYDDLIAEICMADGKTNKDLESLLATVAGNEEEWNGVRKMLGRMHDALQRDPSRLSEFIGFLERIWIRNDYDVPEDLSFIIGVEDDFQLAQSGQWGCIEEIRTALIENLARYQTETQK